MFFVVVVVARRARARARAEHTPKNWLKRRAGARRGTTTNNRKERESTNSKNHGIYDVFAASEKAKIEDKDSETTKTLYFTMFLACGAKTRVQKSA